MPPPWGMGDAVVEKTAAAPEEHPQKAIGWAARDASGHLSPFRFSRRHSPLCPTPSPPSRYDRGTCLLVATLSLPPPPLLDLT